MKECAPATWVDVQSFLVLVQSHVLIATPFGCNAGDDETKAAAVENWERVNNGYRGSNPYERDGTFYWCAKEGKDGWVEVPLDEAQKVWKVGTNFFVLDVATKESLGYSGWEEYTVPTTQKCHIS